MSDIIRHLEKLLVSKEVAKVRLLADKSEIHTHRLIIAARSPVLYAGAEPGFDHRGGRRLQRRRRFFLEE